MVAYQPYAMGRMKFIWGDDAEEFRPERWLNEDGIFQPESPFKFTAFQVSKICVRTYCISTIPCFRLIFIIDISLTFLNNIELSLN